MTEQTNARLPRATAGPAKSCPRCRSERLHRSHRRTVFEHLFHALGAQIRRCHDCRGRFAVFPIFSVPLGEQRESTWRWTERLVVASGFLVCLLFAWWVFRRFSGLSG